MGRAGTTGRVLAEPSRCRFIRAQECRLTLQSRGHAPASRVMPIISNVRGVRQWHPVRRLVIACFSRAKHAFSVVRPIRLRGPRMAAVVPISPHNSAPRAIQQHVAVLWGSLNRLPFHRQSFPGFSPLTVPSTGRGEPASFVITSRRRARLRRR